MLYMIELEENMTNIWDMDTPVTMGDSGKITWTKNGDWRCYYKNDKKLHIVVLAKMDAIPGLHTKLFNVIQALKKGFQFMPKV